MVIYALGQLIGNRVKRRPNKISHGIIANAPNRDN